MRVSNTLAACALSAALLCAPPTTRTAQLMVTAQPPAPQQPTQTPSPSPPQQQEQQRSRRTDETQPPPQQPSPRPAQPPAAGAGAEGVDDDEIVSVDTSLVNVVFNATDVERRFITTLRREDVRVFEDGVPQEVTVFQRETEQPLSIAILVDVSISQENTLPVEKDAARAFINQILRPGKDAAAVVSFTGSATLEQGLTQELDNLHFAIESLRVILPPSEDDAPPAPVTGAGASGGAAPAAGNVAGGQVPPAAATATPAASAAPPTLSDEDADIGHTSVWDAVWAVSNEVMADTPSHTRRAIILLSDGADTKSRIKREAAAEAAVKANTVVYSIGIEPYSETEDYELDKKALRKIAEATGGRAFFPKDETDLNAAFHQIQQELRTQYLAAYTPTNKARDGSFRRLRIELTRPELKKQKLKLAYREGYFALSPPASAARRERPPQDRLTRPPRRKRR